MVHCLLELLISKGLCRDELVCASPQVSYSQVRLTLYDNLYRIWLLILNPETIEPELIHRQNDNERRVVQFI